MMLQKKAFDGTDHLFLIKMKKRKIYLAIKILEAVVIGFVSSHATKDKVRATEFLKTVKF